VPTVYCDRVVVEPQKLSDARMWRVRARAAMGVRLRLDVSWPRQEVSRVFGGCMKGPLEDRCPKGPV